MAQQTIYGFRAFAIQLPEEQQRARRLLEGDGYEIVPDLILPFQFKTVGNSGASSGGWSSLISCYFVGRKVVEVEDEEPDSQS